MSDSGSEILSKLQAEHLKTRVEDVTPLASQNSDEGTLPFRGREAKRSAKSPQRLLFDALGLLKQRPIDYAGRFKEGQASAPASRWDDIAELRSGIVDFFHKHTGGQNYLDYESFLKYLVLELKPNQCGALFTGISPLIHSYDDVRYYVPAQGENLPSTIDSYLWENDKQKIAYKTNIKKLFQEQLSKINTAYFKPLPANIEGGITIRDYHYKTAEYCLLAFKSLGFIPFTKNEVIDITANTFQFPERKLPEEPSSKPNLTLVK